MRIWLAEHTENQNFKPEILFHFYLNFSNLRVGQARKTTYQIGLALLFKNTKIHANGVKFRRIYLTGSVIRGV